ncbi:hypothetical protein RhiirC2_804619, partial [Rhizophagus irregularis]
KHTRLPRSFPLIAIHGSAFYDIVDLFQKLSMNHFSRLQRMMIAEPVRLITRIRIFKLRNTLACGVSPFDITDFSPWMKLRRFSQDWLFRTLQEGFDLKISFKPIFDPFYLKG